MTTHVSVSDLSLSHFSQKPIITMHSVEQMWRYGAPSEHEKPKGLWVSVDGENDWPTWCAAESFGIGSIQHRVVLAPEANILFCKDKLDILCLTERYAIELQGYSWKRVAVDWNRIAQDYQGVIIAPYVWECRLNEQCNWYYGWDCASGCIWDASAISSISPVAQAQAA